MIKFKTNEEIELIRVSAQLVSKTLGVIAERINPGMTTLELDKIAEEYIRDNGGIPGFLGLYGFPNSLCISVNEVVVHGIPNDKPIREGDIVSVDCGVLMNGFYGDHAYTFLVGDVAPKTRELVRVTKESLYLGIQKVKTRNRIGDVSFAIQEHAEKHGYGVVRELTGHGLGRKMHEDPSVPNFGRKRRGKLMKSGLVIAIEPMINLGTKDVIQHKDGWTITTADNKPSAHFEHDVAIRNGLPDILSTFDYVEETLKKRAWDFV